MTISLRRLLSRLTALAISTAGAGAAAAATSVPPGDTATDTRDDTDDLDAGLQLDRGGLDAKDAGLTLGRGLALALDEMRPITATHLAATWALSDDPVRRLALAHALEWQFPLVGDGMVLDHLSRDRDPAVRVAVARAAWARRTLRTGDGVLSRLAADPDPEVRAVAAIPRPDR